MAEEVKPTESEETKTETETKATEKQFSQEDLDKAIDARLKRDREKAQKDFDDKIKAERESWERESKLTAEEKAKEEREKIAKELAAKENSLALRENRADAREKLQEKGISAELVDFIVDVDADKTTENIDKLESVFTKAVAEAVDKRLAGKTPEEKKSQTTDGKKSTYDLLYGK